MELFGRHIFGREAQKSPAEMPGIVNNEQADREAEKASEDAWNSQEIKAKSAASVTIKATVAAESVSENAPTDNVVELPTPEAPSDNEVIGPDHQLPPANVAS